MTNKFKILVIGIGQSNFLNQLYENLIQSNSSISVDVDGYFDISRGKSENKKSIYGNHYDLKNIKIRRIRLFFELLKLFSKKLIWNVLFFELSQNSGFAQIKRVLLSFARAQYLSKRYITSGTCNLLHFHFCIPESLVYLHFIPKRMKSICSFWGSDLMRITGVSNVYYVQMALRKATAITIQTRELAEILYCKYGREFSEKVEILPFTISTELYENLDKLKNNKSKINEFKQKHRIPLDKIIIAVSHNAFEENNHLKIINEISNIDNDLKNKVALILPLGYGGTKAYRDKLISTVKGISGLEIIYLLDYFNPQDTALLRYLTDIMIQMPISDALSGAMTEVLYAGNKVIAGSWLPYGVLRRNGVEFIEIEDFKKLSKIIEDCIVDFDLQKNTANPEKIKSFLFPNTTTPQWDNLFKKVLNA